MRILFWLKNRANSTMIWLKTKDDMEEKPKKLTIEDFELTTRCMVFLKKNKIDNLSSLLKFSSGNLRNMQGCTPSIILELRRKLGFHDCCLYGDIIIKSPASVVMSQELPRLLQEVSSCVSAVNYSLDRMHARVAEIAERIDQIRVSEEYKK